MSRIIEFIRIVYVAVLFILLEGAAIYYYAYSDSYTRAKIVAYSNSAIGGTQGAISSVGDFFRLPSENRMLVDRVIELEAQLNVLNSEVESGSLVVDSLAFIDPSRTYTAAKVVSNTINKRNNLMVLDKGISGGIREDMAVVTPDWKLVGYVSGCSESYATVTTVLNMNFSSSGKISGGTHFGSIRWLGDDRYQVHMSELSKYAEPQVGSPIVSTGFSRIFPPDVLIGEVAAFEFNEMATAYELTIDLAADISAVDNVIVIGLRDGVEIEELIEQTQNQD